MDSASYSLYTFSLAVAIQAFLVISLGAAADERACALRRHDGGNQYNESMLTREQHAFARVCFR